MKKALLLAAALLAFLSASAKAADCASIPAGAKRILVLGDSITYGGQYVCMLEAYFAIRAPERQVEFINVGLPSETVSGLSEDGHAGGRFPRPDLHERLTRVLDQTKPDLVLACYGMNDGIYQPLSDDRFQKFKDGMNWLHEQITSRNAKIIHITPPTYDGVKGGNAVYNDVLGAYSKWLLSRRSDGWEVIDVHSPMDAFLSDHRKNEPAFALAGDGIHPGDLGHFIIARQILLHWGAKDLPDPAGVNAITANYKNGPEILKLVSQRQNLMKDAWLTATHHKRPEMAVGLPLAEAQAKAAELTKQLESLGSR